MKKQTITILGRKTDLHLLIGSVLLTIFIITNTSLSCMNKKKCKGKCKDKSKCKGCNCGNSPCTCGKGCNCGNSPCTCGKGINRNPSLENSKMPPHSNITGANQNTFSNLASI
jgi:hypothetical protein